MSSSMLSGRSANLTLLAVIALASYTYSAAPTAFSDKADRQAERAFKSTFAAQNVRILQSMRSKNLARTKLRLASPVLVPMNQAGLLSSSSVAVNEAEQQIFEMNGRRTEKEWDRLLVSFSV